MFYQIIDKNADLKKKNFILMLSTVYTKKNLFR